MASNFQAAPLVASPSYPNSIAWSDENLVAIASSNLITILNPNLLVGPRGVITLPPNKPFPIGVVKRQDLFTPCLQPISLSRETRPCARSLSWSPLGFAPNSACLLAVCTTNGRVKLYRQPICELRTEWVEVLDISDLLFDCLQVNNFGEVNDANRDDFHQDTIFDRNDSIHGKPMPGLSPCDNTDKVVGIWPENCMANNENGGSCPRPGKKSSKKREEKREGGDFPIITAGQYASRSAQLSSLIVAWSPVLHLSLNCVSNNYAILAVSGKSGHISFWRFTEPECYTIEHGASVDAVLVERLHAHNSWVTAISWEIFAGSCSEFQLVLASGSSDGSVKVWLEDVKGMVKSSETHETSFSLFKEVSPVSSGPISAISLVVPEQSLDRVVLAIGKGSGSLEVWICHISSNKLESAGVYDAHDQVVTGLTWAFGGCCLYSCSQDNSLQSWIFYVNSRHEVPFSSKFPGMKNSSNLSQVSDQCFGLALSPGDLIIAVVGSFDARLLNPMYQARRQKAVVEFFWIGGQPLAMPSNEKLDCGINGVCGLTDRDLMCWGSSILRSLEHYNNLDKVVLLWDVITALSAFMQYGSTFIEVVLSKWISSWFSDLQSGVCIEKVLSHAQNMLSKISTRKMHILNIICRRLMLGAVKANVPNDKEGKVDLWNALLIDSEREIQARLVAFTFRAVLSCVPCSSTVPTFNASWSPIGVALMKRWLLISSELVPQQLKLLGSKVGEPGSRVHLLCENATAETCSFCSASVPFESPEVAWCEGIKHQDGSSERHKLARCAVSMELCSVTVPMWFCICCQRWAAKLPPRTFFTMPKSPLDVNCDDQTFTLPDCGRSRPLCPFCGILLQRLLPEFLLSASPV